MKEFNFETTPIVDIVNRIIIDAVMQNASDIHFVRRKIIYVLESVLMAIYKIILLCQISIKEIYNTCQAVSWHEYY